MVSDKSMSHLAETHSVTVRKLTEDKTEFHRHTVFELEGNENKVQGVLNYLNVLSEFIEISVLPINFKLEA